jgi:hypothetical protein
MSAGSLQGSGKLPRRLIQIVPRFRPDADGLGEFSLCLGNALWQQCKIPSGFVVWSPPRATAELPIPAADFPHCVIPAIERRRASFRKSLQQACAPAEKPIVLLHYTSYAFSTEGIAWWLPGLLREFVQDGGRIVTFFHELYASGKFPNKTWLSSGLQRHIFREILALSSAAISSNERYMREMAEDNRNHRPLALAGICSNVGEASILPPVSERLPRLAVFGLAPSRRRLYEQHLPVIVQLARHLKVDEVADIGSAGDWPQLREEIAARLGEVGVGFKVYGALPADKVGELLAHSRAGAVNYTSGMHLKSGIVGAYQAYGLPVILFRPAADTAPAAPDPTYLLPQSVLAAQSGMEEILNAAGRAGFEFYRENRSYDAILGQVLPWLQLPE